MVIIEGVRVRQHGGKLRVRDLVRTDEAQQLLMMRLIAPNSAHTAQLNPFS